MDLSGLLVPGSFNPGFPRFDYIFVITHNTTGHGES